MAMRSFNRFLECGAAAVLRCAAALAAAGAALPAVAGMVSVTVVDKEGRPVQDAVVVLQPAAGGTPRTPLPVAIVIDQRRMQFVPAVSLVPVGAKITFTNSDAWDHHVRGSAAGSSQFASGSAGGFEMRLDGKVDNKPAASGDMRVAKAGPVLLGCHIHGSMRGHLYVSDSPWAAKTNADGVAAFDDVPDGAAQLRVWQADQLVDLPPQTLAVGAQPVAAQAQLQVVPRRRRAPVG